MITTLIVCNCIALVMILGVDAYITLNGGK